MKLRLFFAVLLLTNVASALAQDVSFAFVSPTNPLIAGSRGSVWLLCMNNSSNKVNQTLPPSLNCVLSSESGSFQSVLLLNTNNDGMQAAIAPGSFTREEYLLDIPATINGPVKLDVSNYNQVVILVKKGSLEVPRTTKAKPPSNNTDLQSPFMGFLGPHISGYEPIYFILGTYPAAEFQFSLKFKVFEATDNVNPFAHLYFAYTQTSFWDLISQDPSFYDSSYKPSAFLYYPDVVTNKSFQFDLQGGTEHESNGRGGSLERSVYTTYLQPTAKFDLTDNLQLTIQPRAWFYYWVGGNNPDIAGYRGYADLLTSLTLTNSCGERIQLATKLRIGDEGLHAGLQFDLRFNLPQFLKFNPTFQVQYFTGYGQTFRQYDQTSHGLRAGFCLYY
jgi:outer membrane phospholipase A